MLKTSQGDIKMTGQLQDKVALVTGAGSGIGRATALTFAREGAKVVVADVAVEGGQETVRLIKEAGGEAVFVKTDVKKASEVEALVNKAVEIYGRLDCAHNNAGTLEPGAPFTECTEENWDRVIDTNLKGVWLCMKYELIHMTKHGGGAIVNTASVAGLRGLTGRHPAYGASKHGVVGLTRAAAVEYAKAGIRVNAVCPGSIRTPMTKPTNDAETQEQVDRLALQPLGRRGEPQEVSEAVVWLCTDAASFVNGCLMSIDGGWNAQ
jgi:NAD(P)-dependent dehydrogenase (short-subunit alcohol dehydrogenase family)